MTCSIDNILNEFYAWMDEADDHPHIIEPTAASLATVDGRGVPTCRTVLLKAANAQGFTFFTNYDSVKGRALAENPRAALHFYWMPLKKQVRIEGSVTKTSAQMSDTYFSARPYESQVASFASSQSQVIPDYHSLIARFEAALKQFEGAPVPRPEHWGGYVLAPTRVEFWEEKPHRLHNRYEYVPSGSGWVRQQLNP